MSEVELDQRQWTARHRFARIAPRKLQPLMTMIRRMPCRQAIDVLRFNPKRGAVLIRSLLKSAMSNANEQEADMNRLFVCEARVDGGPIMRRWRPKDRGRAHPIRKRTSHLFLAVQERP